MLKLWKKAPEGPKTIELYVAELIAKLVLLRAASMARVKPEDLRRRVDDLVHDMKVQLDDLRRDHG